MSSGEVYEVWTTPWSLTTSIACTAIWFYLWNYRVPAETFAFNYDKIVRDGQHWRMLSGSYSHLHILHLLFNMASCWSLRLLEVVLGLVTFLKYIFLLVLLTTLLMLLVSYIRIKYFRHEAEHNT